MSYRPGRHFLQIPGPTNVPERVLRAIDYPTMDHRGPEFAELGFRCLEGMQKIFKTQGKVVIFPSSGTGAWEAALVNTLSPGDHLLMYETGHFAMLWHEMARKLGLRPELLKGDWRTGADPERIAERLKKDTKHEIKAVCVVHNETSTGVTSRIGEIRKAMDSVKHPALYMVDTISSLASIDYRHDEWGVDVTVGGSQKGLMLPPGLGFNAVGEKALEASGFANLPHAYWDWNAMFDANKSGFFPYTPATNLLYGLDESLKMLIDEEGLENVFARHDRHAEATRRAVRAWDLEILCTNPAEYSSSLTAVLVPDGHNADELRKIILDGFDMSLGTGLTKLAGRVFRIGHLGDFNDLMLAGTLCGVEMGLMRSKIPHKTGGVDAALSYLALGDAAEKSTARTRAATA
ncbi:MAG: aminotransferase class V-fold PLP-dependent enzyme [Gammaproteobacteria bacterium]|nr:aminotransferase class V-fold PLP-dependent enzyme [Gammaproteobacteria bacterium]